MSSAIVLDTDIVVDILRGRDEVLRRLAARSPDAVGVTTMTVAELRYGALVSRDAAGLRWAEHRSRRTLPRGESHRRVKPPTVER